MRHLPLYVGEQRAVVQLTAPLLRDALAVRGTGGRACPHCDLGAGPRNPCLPAEGDPGGLLVVGDAPTMHEDQSGIPFVGMAGKATRALVGRWWRGPVAYDYAVRCAPGRQAVKAKHVTACRAYLAATLAEVAPVRVVVLGSVAMQGVTGRTTTAALARRACGWLAPTTAGGPPVPVFVVPAPGPALRNRFLRATLEADMEWALTTASPPLPPWGAMTRVIETAEDAEDAAAHLRDAAWVAVDVETTGTMWGPDFTVISVSLCADGEDDAWTWPRAALAHPGCLAPLRDLLTDPTVAKAGQNVKYDQLALRAAYGWDVRPCVLDTRLQRKLVDPEADGALDRMAELVGMGGMKDDAAAAMDAQVRAVKRALRKPPADGPLVPGLRPELEAMLRLGVPPERVMYGMLSDEACTRYNARDVVATARLGVLQGAAIAREPAFRRTWAKLVQPAAEALVDVEANGVAVSVDAIRAFDQYLGTREDAARAVLAAYGDVNWASPQQVAALLYDTLGLRCPKLTEGGARSTDAAVLETLAKQHPLPHALLDFRTVTKLRGTYAAGMMDHVRPDGRIHPNIKLDGARSGRTSCTDPNLQNIPRASGSPEGKMARDVFIASPGCVLYEADYSQLELRVAAALSGDEDMRAIFAAGEDYHLRTAQLVSQAAWGVPPEAVTDAHRSQAKAFNFGLLYGQGDAALAGQIGCTVAHAARIREAVLGKFRRLAEWVREQLAFALRHGHAWTWWDGEPARRRSLWRIADPDDGAASVARNGAHNTPIQGTASDFCLASLAACNTWARRDFPPGAVKLVLAIHDALLFDVREDLLPDVHARTKATMESWPLAGVPLVSDAKAGPSWGSMKSYPPRT